MTKVLKNFRPINSSTYLKKIKINLDLSIWRYSINKKKLKNGATVLKNNYSFTGTGTWSRYYQNSDSLTKTIDSSHKLCPTKLKGNFKNLVRCSLTPNKMQNFSKIRKLNQHSELVRTLADWLILKPSIIFWTKQ